jgi:hypothetical protein
VASGRRGPRLTEPVQCDRSTAWAVVIASEPVAAAATSRVARRPCGRSGVAALINHGEASESRARSPCTAWPGATTSGGHDEKPAATTTTTGFSYRRAMTLAGEEFVRDWRAAVPVKGRASPGQLKLRFR